MSDNAARLVELIERAALARGRAPSRRGRRLDPDAREALRAVLAVAPTDLRKSCERALVLAALLRVPDAGSGELLADVARGMVLEDEGDAGRVPLSIWLSVLDEPSLETRIATLGAEAPQAYADRHGYAAFAIDRYRGHGVENTRGAWRADELGWALRCVAIAAEHERWHPVEIAETLEAHSSYMGTTLRAWVLHAMPPERIELLTFSTGKTAAQATLAALGDVAWLLDSTRRMALCKALAPCRQRSDPSEWTFDLCALVMACEPMAVDLLAALLAPDRLLPTRARLDALAELTPEEWTSIDAALDVAGRAAQDLGVPWELRAPEAAEDEHDDDVDDSALEVASCGTVLTAPGVPPTRIDLGRLEAAGAIGVRRLLDLLRACGLDWQLDVSPAEFELCVELDTSSLCRAIDGTADEATRLALARRLIEGEHSITGRGSVREARGVRALGAVTTLENLHRGLSRATVALLDRVDAMRAWVAAAMPWVVHPEVPVTTWVHGMASIDEMSGDALARVFGESPGRDFIRTLGARALEPHRGPEHAGFRTATWALATLLRSTPKLDAQDRAFAKMLAEECARRPHIARRSWSVRDVLLEALADGADVHAGLAAVPRSVMGIRGSRVQSSWSRRQREWNLRGEEGSVRIARLPR